MWSLIVGKPTYIREAIEYSFIIHHHVIYCKPVQGFSTLNSFHAYSLFRPQFVNLSLFINLNSSSLDHVF